jgi:hypothetical protein
MLKRDGVLPLGGMHGYDNLLPDMFAIFIATGPLFRSADNDGTLITKPFENIDLYNVLAHLLRIAPAPNNGSISTMDMLITKA